MSSVMGISLGQIITPLIIKNAEDIQMMNIIWFVPAAIGKEKKFLLAPKCSKWFRT